MQRAITRINWRLSCGVSGLRRRSCSADAAAGRYKPDRRHFAPSANRPKPDRVRQPLWRMTADGGYPACMEEADPSLARTRVAVSTVLASIVGMWACYFVLTTVRAEI